MFTLRPWFEALFDRVGASLGDALHLRPLPLLARHAWSDGARLDLHLPDLDATVDAISAAFASAPPRDAATVTASSVAWRIFGAFQAPYNTRAAAEPADARHPRRTARGPPGDAGHQRRSRACGCELEREFTDPRLAQLSGRHAASLRLVAWPAPATPC